MLGTSNCAICSTWNPKRSAKYVHHTGTLASSIARAGTSCEKEEGNIRNSSSTRWTFFQFLSTSSRKDDLTDIDMVRSREGILYGARKSFFQGIHDRFIRDETFCNRMVENGRNEEVCRQIDALADEDHTHHLTSQEYNHYKSNWWLRSNKKGSNTVPVQRRPDFKQTLSYLTAIETGRRRSSKEINNGHRVLLLLHGGVGKVSSWTPYSYEQSTMEMNQVLIEQGDLLFKYLEQVFKA